jgi:hypothetical protein
VLKHIDRARALKKELGKLPSETRIEILRPGEITGTGKSCCWRKIGHQGFEFAKRLEAKHPQSFTIYEAEIVMTNMLQELGVHKIYPTVDHLFWLATLDMARPHIRFVKSEPEDGEIQSDDGREIYLGNMTEDELYALNVQVALELQNRQKRRRSA